MSDVSQSDREILCSRSRLSERLRCRCGCLCLRIHCAAPRNSASTDTAPAVEFSIALSHLLPAHHIGCVHSCSDACCCAARSAALTSSIARPACSSGSIAQPSALHSKHSSATRSRSSGRCSCSDDCTTTTASTTLHLIVPDETSAAPAKTRVTEIHSWNRLRLTKGCDHITQLRLQTRTAALVQASVKHHNERVVGHSREISSSGAQRLHIELQPAQDAKHSCNTVAAHRSRSRAAIVSRAVGATLAGTCRKRIHVVRITEPALTGP